MKLKSNIANVIKATLYPFLFCTKRTYNGEQIAIIKKTLIIQTYPKPPKRKVETIFLRVRRSKKYNGLNIKIHAKKIKRKTQTGNTNLVNLEI